MRTLIIDDDDANRKILSLFLTPLGHTDTAPSGDEGLILFKKSIDEKVFYDLVVLDIRMPGMDGITTLKNMRALENEQDVSGQETAKIVMMTAVTDKNVVVDAFRQGCNAYVIKPLDREELLRQIKMLKLINA